jgi:hypothetical protein
MGFGAEGRFLPGSQIRAEPIFDVPEIARSYLLIFTGAGTLSLDGE